MQLLFLLADDRQRELRNLAESRRRAREASRGLPDGARPRGLRAAMRAARAGAGNGTQGPRKA